MPNKILITKMPLGFETQEAREELIGITLPIIESSKESNYFEIEFTIFLEILESQKKINVLKYLRSFKPTTPGRTIFINKDSCKLC